MKIYRWATLWLVLAMACPLPLHALGLTESSPTDSRLWRLAELEQETLAQREVLLHDIGMTKCLQTVSMHLWQQIATDLRAPVVNVRISPLANAVTYPNGYILLTTGMLGQIENEDQLAIILAHEIIHYARQHATELYHALPVSDPMRRERSGQPRPRVTEADVEQRVNASENQADTEGLAIFRAAGYCEREILNLMSTMIDHMRVQGPSKRLDDMVARKGRMQAMINRKVNSATCPSTADDARHFRARCIAPALMANVQIAIRHGDWDVADGCLMKYIAIKPDDAQAYYMQGEIIRRRDDNDDDHQSMACYQEALKRNPQFPLVHRALGELHFKAGQYRLARPYFETFLSLSPQDESRPFIEGYLHQCQN